MLKRRILLFLKYGVSIGLLALVLAKADLGNFGSSLKEANLLIFGLGLLVAAFNMLVRSYKWQLLLKVHGVGIPLVTILRLNYMSMFFNNFFLGAIGGDVFRAYRAFGYSDSKGGTVSSIIFDRGTGLVMGLCLMVVLVVGFAFTSSILVSVNQFIALGVSCLIAGLLVLAVFKLLPLLNAGLTSIKAPKLAKASEELMASISVYKSHPKIVVSSLAFSLLYHIGRSVAVYCFILAANLDISYINVLFISVLVGVLIVIPISVNGIGVQEGSYVFYLGLLGAGGPAAFLVAVLARASLLVMSLIGGLLFLIDGIGRRSQAPARTGPNETNPRHLPSESG